MSVFFPACKRIMLLINRTYVITLCYHQTCISLQNYVTLPVYTALVTVDAIPLPKLKACISVQALVTLPVDTSHLLQSPTKVKSLPGYACNGFVYVAAMSYAYL